MRCRGRAGALCVALLAAAAGMHGSRSGADVAGPGGRPGAPLHALRPRRLPLLPIRRGAHRRRHGRAGVWAVHGPALRQPPRDGHRAHGGGVGGARQRALRCGRSDEAAVRLRPAEPDAGGARGEPAPEEREGRRGVDAPDEPVLVRGPGRGGQAQVPADRGRARGACPGGGFCRGARRPRWWWPAGRKQRRLRRRRRPRRAGPMRCGAGTRTGTGASPAARRARTASPRCGAGTRPTASCAMATGTAWCASEGADGDDLQATRSGGGDSWHARHVLHK